MSLLARRALRSSLRPSSSPISRALLRHRLQQLQQQQHRHFSEFYKNPRPTDDIESEPLPVQSTPEEQRDAKERWEGKVYEFDAMGVLDDNVPGNGTPVLQDPFVMHDQPLPIRRKPFFFVSPWEFIKAAPAIEFKARWLVLIGLYTYLGVVIYYEFWAQEMRSHYRAPPDEPM